MTEKREANLLKFITVFFGLFIVACLVLLFNKGCSRHSENIGVNPNINHDKNIVLSHEINVIDSTSFRVTKRLKQDSINMSKAYNKLKSKYNNAINQAPDTCRSWIDTIYKEALILDLTDKVTIKRQDTLIDQYKSQVSKLKQVAHNDTLQINYLLNDSIPKIYKSRFWRGYWKGQKHGIAEGILLDEGLRAGIKLIP